MEVAARYLDPVEHSMTFAGAIAGLAVGIAIGVALVLAGPEIVGALAIAAAVGTVLSFGVTFEKLGEWVGKLKVFKHSGEGDIADGAPTVFTGDITRKQARMSDPLHCHSGKTIVEGSDSVYVIGWPASRKGDATECGGKIKDGCHTVLIGGGTAHRPGYGSDEIPAWFKWGMWGLDWASTILGFLTGKGELKVGKELLAQAIGAGSKAYGQLDGGHLWGAKTISTLGSLGSGGLKGKIAYDKFTAGKDALTNASKVGQQGVNAGNTFAGLFGHGAAALHHGT